MSDPDPKTLRSFACRDRLWALFGDMSTELECSVDYLINEAMLAELEGLRAARAADVAEASAILSALGPLVEDAKDSPAEEEDA